MLRSSALFSLALLALNSAAQPTSPIRANYCHEESQKRGFGSASLNMCGGPEDRFAQNFIFVSETDDFAMATANAASLLTPDQQKKLAPTLRQVQLQMAEQCCGLDQTCAQAMQQVQIEWCDPKQLTNRKDACFRGAHYRLPGEDREIIFGQIAKRHWDERAGIPKSWAEKIDVVLARYIDSIDYALRIAWRAFSSQQNHLRPGRVVMSPVMGAGFPAEQLAISTFRHEMAHACDAIKAQQYAFAPAPHWQKRLLGAAQIEHGSDSRHYCRLDEALNEYYESLMSSYGLGPAFLNCLNAVYRRTATRSDALFCSSLCPGAMRVESFAKVFEVLSAAQSKTESLWLSACATAQDGYHLGANEITQCLIEHASHLLPANMGKAR
ncbi:MAG: hypothetical protein AB7N80_05340 [Bdellovibrionales bacterium]